jgi:hypothetical protein
MILDIQKSFQPGKKDIKYLSRDFGQLKKSLVDFAKVYYPNTYKDFNDASAGMMFIEMAAYVGDVLSYYTDYQFKESLLINAEERKNIISLARYLGYKVKATTPSVTKLDVYQLVPSKLNSDGTFSPDLQYCQVIKPGMVTVSDTGINFVTNDPVDFTVDTKNNPLEISVFQRNSSGQPDFYVLKKQVDASAGQIVSKTFDVGNPSAFYQISLDDTNVVEIIDMMDSDGNRWYETDYLAQDLVPIDSENIFKNDNDFYQNRDTVPFIMKFLKTSRRFVTTVDASNKTIIEFGAGVNSQDDELVVPSNKVLSQSGTFKNSSVSYDPANFLKSKAFGQAPANTTLTVRYIVGGGTKSNVNANSIKNVVSADYFGDLTELGVNDKRVTDLIRSTLKVNNPIPAVGGKDAETNQEIKNNGLANFSAQNRAVTAQDYVVRAYSMSSKYGSISKAYVASENSLNSSSSTDGANNNPFAINLYILSNDSNNRLINTNPALRYNLRNYLNQYRLLTDSVNLLDGFIINIGVEFGIVAYKNYNKRDVLANCLDTVKNYLSIDNMQFSQPINLSRLELEIAKIDGVQSVSYLKLKNLTSKDGDYSQYEYDIERATQNKIVYPSIDPCVFEVRFPTKDVVGKCL